MTVKLLTEKHLEFLSLKGGCTGLSESIHVKMPCCLKSRVSAAQICMHSYLVRLEVYTLVWAFMLVPTLLAEGSDVTTVKPVLSGHSKNRQNKGLKDRL